MEEDKKVSLFERHPKMIFWIRFLLWSIGACILPFIFIVWRFQLFHTISKIQIGGWGIIAFVFVGAFLLTIIKYIKLALKTKYSLGIQCFDGICKIIIPLFVLYAILKAISSNIDLFMQVIGVIIICEAIAIPLNPLPKWAYEAQKNVRAEERKDTMDYLLDGFFRRKEEQENGKNK